MFQPAPIEVIVVVNAPEDASSESLQNNKETLLNIESWKKEHSNNFFRLFSFNAEPAPVSKWGRWSGKKSGNG